MFMEEQKNNSEHPKEECWWKCFHGHGHKYFFIRWILGIAILLFVFFVGMMAGELKGYLKSGRGYGGYGSHFRMMQHGYGMPYQGMMNLPGYQYPSGQPQQQSATPAAPAQK